MFAFEKRPVPFPHPANDDDPSAALAALLVDEIDCGLIACDGHGELRYANHAARVELASGRALTVVDDHLRCAGGASGTLDAALHGAALHGRRQLIGVGRDGDRLMVSVIPLRGAQVDGALVLVMLGRRAPCSTLGLELLASLYGLTLAERRVLGGLMEEQSPRAIAQGQGVALSTVRTHIKAIRDKVGVHGIEGLLLRAAQVPPVSVAWRRCDGGAWRTAAADAPRRPVVLQAA